MTRESASTGGGEREVATWRPNLHSQSFWISFLVLFGGIFLHRSYFFDGGTPNYGDWIYQTSYTLGAHFHPPLAWDSFWGLGRPNIQISIAPVYTVLGALNAIGLSAGWAERIAVFWPVSIVPFLSMYWMLGRFGLRPAARTAGAFLFGANSYSATISLQHPFIILAGAFMPFAWGYLIDGLELARQSAVAKSTIVRKAMLFGLFLSIVLMFDARIFVLAMLPSALLIAFSLREPQRRRPKIAFAAGGFATFTLLQLYWVLPTVFGGSGTNFGDALPPTPFSNFFLLPHALALSMPFYNGGAPVWFTQSPVMLPLFAFPALALGGLIVSRKKVDFRITVFAITACLGVILVKGQNDPFGEVYNWAFTRVPGLQLFRDASKFAVLIAAGYAVLIAVCLNRAYNWWNRTDDDGREFGLGTRQLRLWPDTRATLEDTWTANSTRVLAVVAAMSFVVAGLYGARSSVMGNMEGTLTRVNTPPQYDQFISSLAADKEFGRVFWLPYVSRFGNATDIHPGVTPADIRTTALTLQPDASIATYDNSNVMPDIMNLERLPDVLRLNGVKYVVVDQDIQSEMWNNTGFTLETRAFHMRRIIAMLRLNNAFTQLPSGNGIAVFRLNDNGPLFSSAPSTDFNALAKAPAATETKTGLLKYRVDLNTSAEQTGALHMSMTYDKGWKANFKGQRGDGSWIDIPSEQIALADQTNAWTFSVPDGVTRLRATVGYSAQPWANAGSAISAAFFIFVVGMTVWTRRRSDVVTDRADGTTSTDANDIDLRDEHVRDLALHR